MSFFEEYATTKLNPSIRNEAKKKKKKQKPVTFKQFTAIYT